MNQSLLAWLLAAAAAAFADVPSGPAFELHSTRDGVLRGPLVAVDDAGVRLATGGVRGDEFVSLRRVGAPLPAWPTAEQIVCVNGDRILGKVVSLRDERVRVAVDLGRQIELVCSTTAIAHLWLAAPDGIADPEVYQHRLRMEPRARDLVLLRNGDSAEGTVTGLDERKLRVESEGETTEVERSKIAVVAFSTTGARVSRLRAGFGKLTLTNGCRLSVTGGRTARGHFVGKALGGTAVEVPLERIVAWDRIGGPAVYLSDLKPQRYLHEPFGGLAWPWAADASVVGRPMRLGGSTYDKGLGVHSQSRLTFDLGGRYRRFESLVGLDDQTGRRGGVVVQVLLDGKPAKLAWDGTLTGGAAPRSVRIATAGARQMTLEVDFGARGDVQDHVNWCDARLIP